MKKNSVRFAGGIGNQLFQFSFACWLFENSLVPILDLNRIDTSHNKSYFDFRDFINFDIHFKIKQSKWFMLNSFWYSHLQDFMFARFPFYGKSVFQDYYQTFAYFDQLKNPFVGKEISELSNEGRKIESSISEGTAILAHVRMGDLLKSENSNILNDHYYLRALESISNWKVSKLWIFTDSPELLRKAWKGKEILGYGEVVGLRSPLETFYLLSKAQILITSNSTFSFWAGKLGNNKKKLVFFPDKMNSSIESSSFFLPIHWKSKPASWLSKCDISKLNKTI
jgi:hypothetical protein